MHFEHSEHSEHFERSKRSEHVKLFEHLEEFFPGPTVSAEDVHSSFFGL